MTLPNHTRQKTCVDCGVGIKNYYAVRCRSCAARAQGVARRSNDPGPNPQGLCLCGCGGKTNLARATVPAYGWVIGTPVRYLPYHHPKPGRSPDPIRRPAGFGCGFVLVRLTRGKCALVDAADAPRVLSRNWVAHKSAGKWTAVSLNRLPGHKAKTILLHRFILDAKDGSLVDHANGNPLDNRRSNIRFATPSQNCANKRPRRGTISGFKGVTLERDTGKWVASIRSDGKRRRIGSFVTAQEAADAYDAEAERVFGEFARTNRWRA